MLTLTFESILGSLLHRKLATQVLDNNMVTRRCVILKKNPRDYVRDA